MDITADEYQQQAARTLTLKPDFTLTAEQRSVALAVLEKAARCGERAEVIKKAWFHHNSAYNIHAATVAERYTTLALVMEEVYNHHQLTNDALVLVWNTLGLIGEAGEVVDTILDALREDVGYRELHTEQLRKETGDLLWYIAAILSKVDISLADVMQENIDKLRKRYPGEGYTDADANAPR